MKNFDYLKNIVGLEDLYNYCSAAEDSQRNNYDYCSLNCRRALEYIVRASYRIRKKPIGERDNVFTLMSGEPFIGLVGDDRNVMSAAHFVRITGNKAVHTGSVTRRQAYYMLLDTYITVGAILLRLGVIPELKPFDKELIPKYGKPHLEPPSDIPEVKAEFVNSINPEFIKKPLKEKKVNLDDKTETETRQAYINVLLEEAGWHVMDEENTPKGGCAGVEIHVTGLKTTPSGNGKIDYVLYDEDGLPLALIEAKRTSRDPDEGEVQAEDYAQALEKIHGVKPVIYCSNGYRHHIIDNLNYEKRDVVGFHSRKDLVMMKTHVERLPLKGVKINLNITNRDYQKQAIHNMCERLEKGYRRGLIVMATGTGKTRVACSLCDVLIRHHWVNNILFLADRVNLVEQAYDTFAEHMPDYTICNLSEYDEKIHTKTASLMFSTYQTMIGYIDANEKEFSVGRFDLIILDEAHRSCFGRYTSIFDYFDSFLIGLTATPREDVDRNTFDLFEIGDGKPNFEYSQEMAERENWLVGYRPLSYTTKRMSEGIVYESLTDEEKKQLEDTWAYEQEINKGEKPEPRDIRSEEVMKYITNETTIDLMLEELMNKGLKVDSGEKIGKTIIFASSHDHAKLIVKRFYVLFKGFNPKFCQVIDYKVERAEKLVGNFKSRDNLPQIAVSVDMLDTGIDVPEILNLVIFKPIYSKIKFIQMLGRGTRLCPKLFDDGTDKTEFYVFDFCANFEFFNKKKGDIPAAATQTLSERLFVLRTQVAVALQEPRWQENPDAAKLCTQLKEKLYEQVLSLSKSRIDVRKKIKLVEKFQNKDSWVCLTPADSVDLQKGISKLMMSEGDKEGKLKMELLMLQAELSYLLPEVDGIRAKSEISKIASKLYSEKQTIDEVRKYNNLLKEVGNPKYWKGTPSPTIKRLEYIREVLSQLIKHILGNDRKSFVINISDVLQEKEGVEKPVLQAPYIQRVTDYLMENKNLPVLEKLRNLEKLTPSDIEELERICWRELGTKEEYDAYVKQENLIYGKRVAAFIRKIIQIDELKARKMFSDFLDNSELNSKQEQYLSDIISYVTVNGDIEIKTLFNKAKFIQLDLNKTFGSKAPLVTDFVEKLHDLIA